LRNEIASAISPGRIGLYEPHLGIAADGTGIGHPIADFQTAHIVGDCVYGPGALEAGEKGKRLR